MKIGNIDIYGVIYKIENKINNKVYIGQTTIGFKARYSGGWWNRTHNIHLKSSVNKYGIENFRVCETIDVAFSKNELDIKEILWINKYNSTNRNFGYNDKTGGANGKPSKETVEKLRLKNIGRKLSEDTKIKMSLVRKGMNRGVDNPMYGKNPLANLSQEQYSKLMKIKSENMKGVNNPMYGRTGELNSFYGKHHTQKTKELISRKAKERYKNRSNIPNSISIDLLTKDGIYVDTFDSYISCAEWLVNNNIIKNVNTGRDSISRSIKNSKAYKGYIFIPKKLQFNTL